MTAIRGCFDGTVCIPLEKTDMRPNQKVIIAVLDFDYQDEIKTHLNFDRYKCGEKLWQKDIDSYMRDLRNDKQLKQIEYIKCILPNEW